jgi:hypothetical protein
MGPGEANKCQHGPIGATKNYQYLNIFVLLLLKACNIKMSYFCIQFKMKQYSVKIIQVMYNTTTVNSKKNVYSLNNYDFPQELHVSKTSFSTSREKA